MQRKERTAQLSGPSDLEMDSFYRTQLMVLWSVLGLLGEQHTWMAIAKQVREESNNRRAIAARLLGLQHCLQPAHYNLISDMSWPPSVSALAVSRKTRAVFPSKRTSTNVASSSLCGYIHPAFAFTLWCVTSSGLHTLFSDSGTVS